MTYLNELAGIYDRLEKHIASSGILKKDHFCGDCVRCCLFLYRFPVSSLEISYISEFYRDREHPAAYIDFLNGRLQTADGSRARCPYSRPEGCSIYKARPMCCRLYGFSPFRPLYENCAYLAIRKEANTLWRKLNPLFKDFIDLKFDYYRAEMETRKPLTVSDHLDRGSIYLADHNLERAREEFEEALSLNPRDPISHSYVGWLHEMSGDLESALKKYRFALKLDPQDYTTHLKCGFLLHGMQRLEESFEHYKKALEIDPCNAQAWGNIGLIYVSTGQWKEAEMAYLKALEFEPENPIYHICLGNVWYALNKMRKTISQMKKALKLNREEDLAYLCLGSVYERKGDLKNALSNYRSFVKYTADERKKRIILDKIKYLESQSGATPVPAKTR